MSWAIRTDARLLRQPFFANHGVRVCQFTENYGLHPWPHDKRCLTPWRKTKLEEKLEVWRSIPTETGAKARFKRSDSKGLRWTVVLDREICIFAIQWREERNIPLFQQMVLDKDLKKIHTHAHDWNTIIWHTTKVSVRNASTIHYMQ